jgi:hypothetical protein
MKTAESITCATEVFLALCLLHREHPEREDFSVREIVDRAALENLNGTLRPGVQVHASLHCVANRRPNPLAHSMIYATGKSTRRLLRANDDVHPERNGKHWPSAAEVPGRYLSLVHEAEKRFATESRALARKPHPLTRLVGLGAEIWKGVDPDEYVRGLREGWD